MFGLSTNQLLLAISPLVLKLVVIIYIILILLRFIKAFERIAGALETIAKK